MRVTVVSVKVDLVMVSVTRPSAAGGGGSATGAGARCTVTRTPLSTGDGARGAPRKCAGISAWNSSLVIARDGCFNTLMFTCSMYISVMCMYLYSIMGSVLSPPRSDDCVKYRLLYELEI